MRLIEHLYKLVAPHDCLVCGREGSLACFECLESSLPASEARCYRCNRLSPQSKTCLSCRRNSPIRHLWIRTRYEGTAKELVRAMKFTYSGEAADIVGSELLSILPHLPSDTIIVPTPTVSAHIRQRGLDHTVRIADALSRESGLGVGRLLLRTGSTRQVGASRASRRNQIQAAFRAAKSPPDSNHPILLVDDVLTTGATIEAAAGALRDAGYKTIDALVFAKTA